MCVRLIAAIGFLAALAFPAAAVTHHTAMDGSLTGADGVVIGSSVYSVVFVDDSCIGAFDGCNEVSDFDFATAADAVAAAQALLDQVFVGPYDGATRTHGCALGYCRVLIPYGLTVDRRGNLAASVGVSGNSDLENGDGVATDVESASRNLAIYDDLVYARFTLTSMSEVPLPAPLALLLTSLAGLGWIARRRA